MDAIVERVIKLEETQKNIIKEQEDLKQHMNTNFETIYNRIEKRQEKTDNAIEKLGNRLFAFFVSITGLIAGSVVIYIITSLINQGKP